MTLQTDHATQPEADRGTPRWRQNLTGRFGLLGVLVVVIVVFSVLRPQSFPTNGNAVAILGSEEVVLFLAMGVTLTLRLGDLDLSFGSVMGTAAVITAVLSVQAHLPIALAALIGVAFGAAVGAVNGLLVVKVGLNSFVATLGTMTVVEGIGYGVSKSTVVTLTDQGLLHATQDRFAGLPLGVWYGWILVALLWFAYEWTPFGRMLLFIGGNREAAHLLGLPVTRVRIIAYVTSGAIFGLGGVLLLGSIGSADPSISVQYLLPPLAAAFLGTTAVQLGRFNAIGGLIGAYVLATISTGLQLLGASSWVGYVFNGGALIVAIALARFARGSAAGGGALGV